MSQETLCELSILAPYSFALANFREPPQDEVRGTSKLFGSRLAASRNRLLHFLAPFVATSAGLCPRGHKLPPLTAISRYRGSEIATTNFAEFIF
jgi:hypothetical protein